MAEMHAQRRPVGLLVKIYPKLSETFILEEILGLERLGEELHIFAMQAPTDAIHHDAVSQVEAPVTYIPEATVGNAWSLVMAHLGLMLYRPGRYLSGIRAALSRRGGLADFVRAGWLAHNLLRKGIRHLHTHFISRPADIAELVAKLGVPFSISAHAKDIYLSDPQDLQRKLKAARFTVTCTEYNRETLARIAPGADIQRMYHGVDAHRFCREHDHDTCAQPLILAVGRLREKKGFDTLIEACRRLALRGLDFRCEIVGYGEEYARLQQQIEREGLLGRVRLAGKLPREGVIERYNRAAVFVQPSRIGQDGDRDGIPNVLLEAMAMELPVVSTRVSGIPEVVRHEQTGLLIDPDRPADLAEAIARLMADAPLRARLGQAGREAVQTHFDNDRNLKLLRSHLENAHDCPRRAPLETAAHRSAGLS
ncbi:MAG: glycosyltransferase family 4 protein [Rhodocyclaceae bacterium]|nr:glycosyltransferase family 4 protein [Rhodocyclaceae bacterium]